MRSILLALLFVPTAVGQDISITPLEFGTVRYFAPPAFPGLFQPGNESPSVITDVAGFPEHRIWVIYDLAELDQSVSGGTLQFSVVHAGVIGRESLMDYLFVQFRETLPHVPQHFMPTWTEAEIETIWNDIGDGSFYGGRDISRRSLPGWEIEQEPNYYSVDQPPLFGGRLSGRGDLYVQFPLSAAAIHDINAARGGDWAAGVSIAEVDVDPLKDDSRSPPYFFSEYAYLGGGTISGWFLKLDYGPPPPLGDFTGDGVADQADLDFVLLNWGLPTDQDELDAVLLTWGQGNPPLVAASVPEPTGVGIVAACVIMSAWRGLRYKMRTCRRNAFRAAYAVDDAWSPKAWKTGTDAVL